MRKALALFLVILITFTSVYACFAVDIGKENDNVVFTETILQGDNSFAEGITVETSYQYEHRLYWNSKLIIGKENKAETDFEFHKDYTSEAPEIEDYIEFYTETGFSSSWDFDNEEAEFTGINKAYKELYDKTKPGEEGEMVIVYKDYMDYYPMAGEYYTNGSNNTFGSPFGFSYEATSEAVQEKIEAYFKIPVIDEECRNITMTKDQDGTVMNIGSNQASKDTDSYSFYSESAQGKDGLYLVFSNRTDFGEIVDMSLIPGGYGIYFFPYHTTGLDFNNIQTVYSVDVENEILDITMSKDKKKIHLITKEKDELILNVIDVGTMTCLQKITLHKEIIGDPEYDYFGADVLETDNDFIVYGIYDDYSEYAVVTIDESGYYNMEFKIRTDIGFYDADFEWDGEYLYSADYYSDFGVFRETVDVVRVGVLGKDGVKFYATYNTSLNTGETKDYRSDYYCYPSKSNPVIKLN